MSGTTATSTTMSTTMTTGATTSTSTTATSTTSATTMMTSSTGPTTGMTGSSSTGGPGCGNGEVDDGEECDDADASSDRGCSDECEFFYDEVWTLTGQEETSGVIHDVIIGPTGDVFTAGSAGGDIWVQRLGTDGSVTWSELVEPGAANAGHAVALLPDGDVVVGGQVIRGGGDADAIVMRVPAAGGAPVWSQMHDGPGGGGAGGETQDGIFAVAVASDGTVVVGGREGGVTTMLDGWVAAYTDAGVEQWQQSNDGGGAQIDDMLEVGIGAGGDVVAVVFEHDGMSRRPVARRFTLAGAELGMVEFPTAAIADAALMPDDGVVLVGGGLGIRAGLSVVKFDANGVEEWSTELEALDSGQDNGALAVAVGPLGNIFATGTWEERGSVDLWFGSFDATGNQRWGGVFRNEGSDSFEQGRAIAAGVGARFIVAGSVRPDDIRDAWIREYQERR